MSDSTQKKRTSRRLFPLYFDLRSRSIVVFGGGRVGERKARLFSQYARVKVISKSFNQGLLHMEEEGSLELVCTDICQGYDGYIKGAFIVIPATSDSKLNKSIEKRASELGILVNTVDEMGDVIVPSIIRKDPITIAISTESPALSKYLRLKLEKELTGDYSEMAKLLSQIRKELKLTVSDQKARSRLIWKILSDKEIWRLLDVSYEKAYMKARGEVLSDERDYLDACDAPQGRDRRD